VGLPFGKREFEESIGEIFDVGAETEDGPDVTTPVVGQGERCPVLETTHRLVVPAAVGVGLLECRSCGGRSGSSHPSPSDTFTRR
jgi:hypothetical protein